MTLMLATAAGLIVNTLPEWRVVDQMSLIPLVATWSALNITVLLLVAMMCLQAPVRRGEERFEIDEPVWLNDEDGWTVIGRIKDLSLSGIAIATEATPPMIAAPGRRLRLFLKGVGFVAGTVARGDAHFLGVHFDLPPSLERDLLIRKIFTSGLDTTTVNVSVWSATIGLLKRIWTVRSSATPAAAVAQPASGDDKLPAQDFVLAPRPRLPRLGELASQREAMAA